MVLMDRKALKATKAKKDQEVNLVIAVLKDLLVAKEIKDGQGMQVQMEKMV